MVLTWTHSIDLETLYRLIDMVQRRTQGIDLDLWYRMGYACIYIIQKRTHGIGLNSWFRLELMVQTWTHGIDKAHGMVLDS